MNTPWKYIEHRTHSRRGMAAVNSPDSGYILWNCGADGVMRERDSSLFYSDFEAWIAHSLLTSYAGCVGEVEGR